MSRAIDDFRRGYSVSDSGGWLSVDDQKIVRAPVTQLVGVDTSIKRYAIEGICTALKTCFEHGGRVLYFEPDCFSDSRHTKLLYDHDREVIKNRTVEIFAGEKGLAFRMTLPESDDDSFATVSDDYNTYLACSIGYKDASIKTMLIEGVEVACVVKATLQEISILSKPPAVDTTFARIVDLAKCGTLADDYAMIYLTGRYVNLHRKAMAMDNGGIVKHGHSTSDYDRAADKFTRLLAELA